MKIRLSKELVIRIIRSNYGIRGRENQYGNGMESKKGQVKIGHLFYFRSIDNHAFMPKSGDTRTKRKSGLQAIHKRVLLKNIILHITLGFENVTIRLVGKNPTKKSIFFCKQQLWGITLVRKKERISKT